MIARVLRRLLPLLMIFIGVIIQTQSGFAACVDPVRAHAPGQARIIIA